MASFLRRLKSSNPPTMSSNEASPPQTTHSPEVTDFDFVDFAKVTDIPPLKRNSPLTTTSTTTSGSIESEFNRLPDEVTAKWENLFVRHSQLADKSIQDMCTIAEGTDGWQEWENKNGIKIEKKTIDGGVQGRATIKWRDEKNEYDFQDVADYIWDVKAKEKYDEGALAMLILKEYTGKCPDYGIVHQAFKGKFGVAGRDFIVVTTRRIIETDNENTRCIIGAVSVEEDETVIELIKNDSELIAAYEKLRSGLVRANCIVAGFVLDYNRENREYKLMYANEADLKTKGIPKWIVNRAKLEQLRVVGKVPECMKLKLKENNDGS